MSAVQPRTPCPDEEQLVGFCRGERARAPEVEAHLGECSACLELVALLLGAPADSARSRPPAQDAPPLPKGTHLGRFELLEPVGRGGMGEVYAAFDPELTRQVALKRVRRAPHERGSEEANRRLQAEARLMAQLQHPNVVTVYEAGSDGEQLYIAMELVRGLNLAQWLAAQPRGWREVTERFLEAGRGLAAAHRAGILHRDFKPANVLIADGPGGQARVADFGLAGWAEGDVAPEGRWRSGGASGLRGTLAYLAPERLLGARATAQSDQFSFCVALREALTGEHPFARPTGAARRLPAGLDAPLARGLSPRPEQRFEKMEPLLDALQAHLRRGPRRKRVAGVLAAGVAVVLLALAGQAGYRRARCASAASLSQTWSAAQREALAVRFSAMKQPLGAELWARLQARLDAYAERWRAERMATCRAPSSRDERPLRLQDACYENRRVALEELVQALTGAPDLEPALTAVFALPRVETCRDVGLIEAELELPDAPALRATAEALRRALAKGQALYVTGRYDEAASTLDEARAAADAAGLKSLQGAARMWRGEVERERGKLEKARGLYREAILLAEERRDPMLGTRSYASLAFVELALARTKEAHEALEHAWALLRGVGASAELEADLLTLQGDLLMQQEKLPQALEAQRRALRLREEQLGADHLSMPQSLESVGVLLAMDDKPEEALPYFERAVALRERQLGRHHSFFAASLSNLALTQAALGKEAEAIPLLEEALATVEPAPGAAPTLDVGKYALNLGCRYAVLEQPARAIPAFERALAVLTEHLGPEHPTVALAHTNLGLARSMNGEPEEAERHLRRALALAEAKDGPDHPSTLLAAHNLAGVLRERGLTAEALKHGRHAVQQLAKAGDTPPRWAAEILQGWGQLLAVQRRWAEAAEAHRSAFARLEHEPTAPERAPVLTSLSEALTGAGRLDEAQRAAEQAIAEEAKLRDRPHTRARAELALARVLQKRGDAEQAKALTAQAQHRLADPVHPERSRGAPALPPPVHPERRAEGP